MIDKISSAIAKVTKEDVDINDLKHSKELVSQLGLNSITRMRLILELEKTLDVEINLEKIDVSVFNSIEQLEQYIQNNSGETADNN